MHEGSGLLRPPALSSEVSEPLYANCACSLTLQFYRSLLQSLFQLLPRSLMSLPLLSSPSLLPHSLAGLHVVACVRAFVIAGAPLPPFRPPLLLVSARPP